MKRILLINPFGIGDVLFTTPVIKALKERYPDCFLAYWCNERVKDILSSNPYIDKFITGSRGDIKKIYKASKIKGLKKSISLVRQLRSQKFDTAIDFSLEPYYRLFLLIAGVPVRIGFNFKNRGRFLTKRIDISGYEDKHMVEYYLSLLDLLGIKAQTKQIELFFNPEDLEWADDFLRGNNIANNDLLIGIVPGSGASWGKDARLKRWSPQKFARLSDELIDRFNAKIIVFGSSDETDICREVVSNMQHKTIEAYAKTDLRQLAALIKKCKLLITNDGGPLHVAVALGVKTVSIFGPVDERVYGPYPASELHLVIKKELTCRPCYREFRLPVCKRSRECLNSISADEVLRRAEVLL